MHKEIQNNCFTYYFLHFLDFPVSGIAFFVLKYLNSFTFDHLKCF